MLSGAKIRELPVAHKPTSRGKPIVYMGPKYVYKGPCTPELARRVIDRARKLRQHVPDLCDGLPLGRVVDDEGNLYVIAPNLLGYSGTWPPVTEPYLTMLHGGQRGLVINLAQLDNGHVLRKNGDEVLENLMWDVVRFECMRYVFGIGDSNLNQYLLIRGKIYGIDIDANADLSRVPGPGASLADIFRRDRPSARERKLFGQVSPERVSAWLSGLDVGKMSEGELARVGHLLAACG